MSHDPTQTFAWFVGRRIRTVRRAADLTQEVIAERAGIHRTNMSLYENGQKVPKLETFVKIAMALGVSPCELLPGLEWDPNGHLH